MSNLTSGNQTIDEQLSQMLRDGVSMNLFTCPCLVKFGFVGDVQVSSASSIATFTGQARIEAPFSLTTSLMVQIHQSGDYLVRFSMPGADQMVRSVVKKASHTVRETVEALVLPYLKAQQCAVLVASQAGSDETFGPYVSGINFVAALKAGAVEPLRSLADTFPMLKLQDRSLQLHTASMVGPELGFVVEGNLVLNAALGTPTVVLRTVGLRVDQSSTELAACASVVVGVRAGSDDLIFTGSLTGSIPAQVTVAVSLDVADGAWKNPFGLKGLTITNAGLQIGASPKPPYVSAGVRGGFAIGGDALQGEAAILIDPSAPEKTILYLDSPNGMDLRRLLRGLVQEGLVPAEVLDVSLKKVKIYAAPSGGSVANRDFAAGYELSGVLDLWGFDASLAGQFSHSAGGFLKGAVDRIDLAKEVTVFQITDGASGGPSMDIQFNTAAKSQHLRGAVRVADRFQSIDANLGRDGFSIALQNGNMGLYTGATLGYLRGTASTSGSAGFDMMANVGGIEIGVKAVGSAAVSASAKAVTTRVSLSASAFGASVSFGPASSSIAVSEVKHLKYACEELFDKALSEWATLQVRGAGTEVLVWLRDVAKMTGEQAAVLFQRATAACGPVVEGLRTIYNLTDVQATRAMDSAGYLSKDIATAIGATYKKSAKEVGKIMREAECSSKEIAAAMKGAYGWSADETARFMKDTLSFGDKAVSEALSAAGYAESAIRDAMKDVYGWGEDAWNEVTGALGF